MPRSMSAELLASLKRIDTCALANAIETFNVRLRNEGFCDGRVRSMFPKVQPMVGHAVTVRIRGNGPAMDGHTYLERTDWWAHILSQPAPRVVVIQDMDAPPGLGGFVGEVHAAILRSLGCVGAVTNGAVRDLPAVEAMGFPLFAHNAAVSHAYCHIVDVGVEVSVGGLKVNPGDWLHGDIHGVLSIPQEIAKELPETVESIRTRERKLIEMCADPELTAEKLGRIFAKNGAKK